MFHSTHVLTGHKDGVLAVAFSSDGSQIVSGSRDNLIRVWNVTSGECIRMLVGHTDVVRELLVGSDRRIYSASDDASIRIWNLETGEEIAVLQGHSDAVYGLDMTPDGKRLISGSSDRTIRVWDVQNMVCDTVLNYEKAWVNSVVVSPDGESVLAGTEDGYITLWNIRSGTQTQILDEHSLWVWSLALSSNGSILISGSGDSTVGLWDLSLHRRLAFLEGHTDKVSKVTLTKDGRWGVSASLDGTARVWDLNTGRPISILRGHTDSVECVAISDDGRTIVTGSDDHQIRVWSMSTNKQDSVSLNEISRYTNAKVLLVGESGVGKTGLSKRLALNAWEPSDSTIGTWATQWKLPVDSEGGMEREIWLWDFGGQADQRLIHQLYMDETALAVLVFDGQKEDLFETLREWDRALTQASRKAFTKLLVAGRIDAGGLRCSPSQVQAFAEERGYPGFLETSAKVGTGCEELKQAILDGIRWENIPWRTSPRVFKRLKEEVMWFKDENRVLMRFNELRDSLQLRMADETERFSDDELKAVIGLLAGPGAVWKLKFGSWVLLQPERINAYAQAVIQTLREDRFERGCIPEEKVLAGDLTYHSSIPRLPEDEERIVLLAMHQMLVERALCLREHSDTGTLLIFPSYYRRERRELTGHPTVQVSYRFHGFLDDIYATLVVRLHHTKTIENDKLWRYAADFKTLTGKQLGVKLTRLGEGVGELEVYFDPDITIEEKIFFSKYIHEHVMEKGQDVVRLRHYICPHCGTVAYNREVAMKRLNKWHESGGKEPTMICVECEDRIPLWDEMEQYFASPKAQQRVRAMQEQSEIVLDKESKERALVGEVISTVALAGQISREFSVSDHGIDMEVEFKNDEGEMTGQKLYLQLKSDSLYQRKQKPDGSEVFWIKDSQDAEYWQKQAFPVLLVVSTSGGGVRWMEIGDYLKQKSENGKNPVKHILFQGERFDVMSVRRWREKAMDRRLH